MINTIVALIIGITIGLVADEITPRHDKLMQCEVLFLEG